MTHGPQFADGHFRVVGFFALLPDPGIQAGLVVALYEHVGSISARRTSRVVGFDEVRTFDNAKCPTLRRDLGIDPVHECLCGPLVLLFLSSHCDHSILSVGNRLLTKDNQDFPAHESSLAFHAILISGIFGLKDSTVESTICLTSAVRSSRVGHMISS